MGLPIQFLRMAFPNGRELVTMGVQAWIMILTVITTSVLQLSLTDSLMEDQEAQIY